MSRCKYEMRERQVSYDDGLTWTSIEVIKGDLIEYQSADCPDSGSEITKWVDLEGDYICDDNKKYKKQVLYVSYDNGITWYIDLPTVYRQGEYVGVDDEYCSFKFEGHYIGTIPTPTPSPRPKPNRLDPLKIVACNNDPTLNGGETSYYTPMDLLWGRIGNCVTSIGDNAFNSYHSFSSITIPNSVTSIGYQAFYYCYRLSNITIPSGVTSIGGYAFEHCENLPSINIPSGITSIGDYTFSNCYSLSSCTFEQGSQLTSIGENAFGGCIFTNFTIPSGVTSIGDEAFEHCENLPSINIPSGITSIGDYTFSNCYSLSSIDIPSGVTSIGSYAFHNCTSLTSITVNATTPPTLGSYAFTDTNNCPIYVPCYSVNVYKNASGWRSYSNRISRNPNCPEPSNTKFKATYSNSSVYSAECDSHDFISYKDTNPSGYVRSAMTSAVIGECINSLSESNKGGTFAACVSLSSVTIPYSVASIGGRAFNSCSGLTRINSDTDGIFNLPSGVTSIGDYAFAYCQEMRHIVIPSTVSYMETGIVESSNNLESITILATNPPSTSSWQAPLWTSSSGICPIYVPSGSVNSYKSASGWRKYRSWIQAIP